MSKKLKIMFAFMAIIILCLGCALVSVAVTLGQPYGTTAPSADALVAPALNEVPAADPAVPTAPEPAVSHIYGWTPAEEAEVIAYGLQSTAWLDRYLDTLDDAMFYNDQMVANTMVVFDASWISGYDFVTYDMISLAEECMAWDIPPAPMSEVDLLTKKSCAGLRLTGQSLAHGLDSLRADDIDGFIYHIENATGDMEDSSNYLAQASTRLDQINDALE